MKKSKVNLSQQTLLIHYHHKLHCKLLGRLDTEVKLVIFHFKKISDICNKIYKLSSIFPLKHFYYTNWKREEQHWTLFWFLLLLPFEWQVPRVKSSIKTSKSISFTKVLKVIYKYKQKKSHTGTSSNTAVKKTVKRKGSFPVLRSDVVRIWQSNKPDGERFSFADSKQKKNSHYLY